MSARKTIAFGNRAIGSGHPVCIVAEIGINHEGDVAACARLIEAVAAAGADAIKLQTIDADANYVRGTKSHEIFSGAALTREETARMFALARELGLEAFTTAGDFETLAWVDALAPAAHKISSGLLTHTPLIERAAATGRPLVVSTGLGTEDDIARALDAARKGGAQDIVLLHCTSLYPTPPERARLSRIGQLEKRFSLPVGFSDHTEGTLASALAVACGAVMLEKHVTLDRTRAGFDHAISLEPEGLADLVANVRRAERMLAAPQGETPSKDEEAARERYLRCLVAAHDIPAGTALSKENIAIKRPLPGRRGLPPWEYERVLGLPVAKARLADDPIRAEDLEERP